MKLSAIKRSLPSAKNVLLALLSAVLLVLAFPPFELWFTAWFAFVPLLWAIDREACVRRSFVLGWLFGNVFFFATCWWLTFAPITYAGFPAPLAYFLLFCVTSVAAIFPGIFAAVTAFLLNRFGSMAFLAAPFVWVFTEFLRYWLTGNNWNAVGYFAGFHSGSGLGLAAIGGVYLTSFLYVFVNVFCVWIFNSRNSPNSARPFLIGSLALSSAGIFFIGLISIDRGQPADRVPTDHKNQGTTIIAIQPNVPMAGLTYEKWQQLRQKHVELAEAAIQKMPADTRDQITVIFPESPMNFMYDDDPETREFIDAFATRNNVSVLFNSAEPDKSKGKYFNSAVMVGPEGKEVAQYDKIYLLPFGEAVPFPLEGLLPGFVGNFSYGREYDLLPIGQAKAGVMICFESHFGQLSRRYVQDGADVIIEMTNDGYLGPTPVLRQHLANAVFRAVETHRPVLRVTNVGITAYINERGEVLDAAEPYTEAARVWNVSRSDGSQTFYVKYGDWFAWLCSFISLGLLAFGVVTRHKGTREVAIS